MNCIIIGGGVSRVQSKTFLALDILVLLVSVSSTKFLLYRVAELVLTFSLLCSSHMVSTSAIIPMGDTSPPFLSSWFTPSAT